MSIQADKIKSVKIPKANWKVRVIGRHKVKDRAIQMLLKLVLEPILEPMGDKHSIGFRPGREFHQVVCF